MLTLKKNKGLFMHRIYLYMFSILCFLITLPAAAGVSDTVSALLAASNSLVIQLLLAMALGLLLSLTPCIYPMIPITVGILQAQTGSSVWQNALRAGAYSCGIATTFALLGLLSAFTGTLFGSFMASPFVIVPMVLLLGYLTGAMLGLYEMYIPRVFQQQQTGKGGSLLAAFSFGAASGTVASPCLSPGLVLLLSIVSTTGNLVSGFALLFAFGVGLSIPLMIIGTFSGSLNVLPRAGMWMVYVKQLFGLLMIGIILYLLKPLVSKEYLYVMGAVTYAAVGIALLLKQYVSYKKINFDGQTLIAILSILVSAFLLYMPHRAAVDDNGIRIAWCTNYPEAHAQALAEKKNILIDVNAPYCTICTAIEGKFFCEENVCNALGNCVPVKINGADTSLEAHEELKKKYKIIGAPTLLLINPETDEELARWGSELYDASIEEFVEQLKRY
jgi:thiol:disulfide interchange protein DsbD